MDPDASRQSCRMHRCRLRFTRSLHVMVVDAGDCGACLNEVRQLNNPLYNMHRLGIFLTATPRTADVLLVVGPVSENMRGPLLKTYEAMPDPKRVVAVGTCAITGGVFGESFMSAGGVGAVLPVDLEIPGDPPPPLAILHGCCSCRGGNHSPAGSRRNPDMVAWTGGALLLFFILCASGLILASILRGAYAAAVIAWFGSSVFGPVDARRRGTLGRLGRTST